MGHLIPTMTRAFQCSLLCAVGEHRISSFCRYGCTKRQTEVRPWVELGCTAGRRCNVACRRQASRAASSKKIICSFFSVRALSSPGLLDAAIPMSASDAAGQTRSRGEDSARHSSTLVAYFRQIMGEDHVRRMERAFGSAALLDANLEALRDVVRDPHSAKHTLCLQDDVFFPGVEERAMRHPS